MTPPHGRPDFGGPQQQVDPAQQLINLQLRLAQLNAQRPSDDAFEALLAAQDASQRSAREQQAQAIADVQAAIAALQAPAPASA